jgi:tetratricopeptide (TPR) repeat protein
VAFLLLGVLGLAGGFVYVLGVNREIETSKQEAVAAKILAEKREREAERARELAVRRQQETERARTQAENKRQEAAAVARFLQELFLTSEPFGFQGLGFRAGDQKGSDLKARDLVDRGLAKIKVELRDRPLVRAAILNTLGAVYQGLGEHQQAEPLLVEALQLRSRPDTPPAELASSLHNLGCLRHDQAQFAEAEKLLRRALTLRKQHLGENDLEVARTEFHLVWTLGSLRWPPPPAVKVEADQLFKDMLRIRRQQLGKEHREVALTLAAWATWKLSLNPHSWEAYPLLDEACTIIGKNDKQEDVARGFSVYLKGMIARNQRRLKEAEALYRQALAVTRKQLGPQHPITALLLGDLAGLLSELKDTKGAEDAIREALAIGRRSHLRCHPLMIEGLHKLANHVRGRNDKEAEALYREALGIARTLHRTDLARPVRDQLISLLRAQNRHVEVKELGP